MNQAIKIRGGKTLHGEVKIQGAKNAAMKHVLIPLMAPVKLTLHNTPNIGSVQNLLKLGSFFGVEHKWQGSTLVLSSTELINKELIIPAEVFFYSSNGTITIPILVSRFGSLTVEKPKSDAEVGGDQIGRSFESVIKTLKAIGIETRETTESYTFTLSDNKPFKMDIVGRSFTASVNSVYSALFRAGVSEINDTSEEPEFYDTIDCLIACGAQIEKIGKNSLRVTGGTQFKDIEYTVIIDKNDLATWLTLAVATNSELSLVSEANLNCGFMTKLYEFYTNWGVNLDMSSETKLHIDLTNINLKPVDIRAGTSPLFHSDWQQLFTPLLSRIDGVSRIVDELFPERFAQLVQLEKLGIEYKISEKLEKNVWGANLREISIFGNSKKKLKGAPMEPTDVRGDAAALIAALMAEGESTISDMGHLYRGYEHLIERLKKIGAQVELM